MERVAVVNEGDIVFVRKRVRWYTQYIGLGLTDQTKFVTATSELARNMVKYGGGGLVSIVQLHKQGQTGLQITFEDQGPGIADLLQAMQDGYTTGKGLGLGLPAARRLVHQFEITSQAGQGTRVTITMWKIIDRP